MFSLELFQSFKFQVCLLVQKGPKFHNIEVPIMSNVQQSQRDHQ